MIRTIIAFLFSCSIASAGVGIGVTPYPGPGVLVASGGGGGVTLAGNSTAGTDGTSSGPTYDALWGNSFTASASGTALHGYARFRANNTEGNAKFIIADSTGAILYTSAPVAYGFTYSNVEFTLNYALTSGTVYKLGVITTTATYASTAGTWAAIIDLTNSYSSPTNFDGNNGDSGLGAFTIWVTN